MDELNVFAISAAGMSFESARAKASALNLANANVPSRPGEPAYTPMRAVAQPSNFADMMHAGARIGEAGALSVRTVLVPSGAAPRRVQEPGHPLADSDGFVSYPGVDAATEMVNLLEATRAYEANVAAMGMARTMALKALDIGGAQ